MTQAENHDIEIAGCRFRDLADLEDYCFWYPEFEDAVIESGFLTSSASRDEVLTYLAAAEIEFGDGNAEYPYDLHFGIYGEAFIDQEC